MSRPFALSPQRPRGYPWQNDPSSLSSSNAKPGSGTVSGIALGVWHCGTFRLPYRKQPLVMGILNVTPDSFSDGGRFFSPRRAVAQALRMQEAGADLIDVGGESTRPGALPVPQEEEMRRVLPVIEKLAGRLTVPISIDTTRSAVARRALEAGAAIINDISGGVRDPDMFRVAAAPKAGLILMHRRGTPQTMQRAPRYRNLIAEVRQFLARQAQAALDAGVARSRIAIDPGIGFGKTVRHNLTLIAQIDALTRLGLPILVGPSRKSFIGKVLARGAATLDASERLFGTAAALAICILHGARIVRVHDVAAALQVVRVADAIRAECLEPPSCP